jgi:hypothetical protein
MGWLQVIHPDDVEHTLEAWRRALASSETLATVHRVRRHDGVYRTFSVRAVPVTGERGQTIEWVGVHTDITDNALPRSTCVRAFGAWNWLSTPPVSACGTGTSTAAP